MMTLDLKDYYLGTILGNLEYIRIPVSILSQHIIDHYNLEPLIHNGFVYAAVSKGMYGLPQAGKLANDQLIARLAPHGYHPVPHTHGLWRDSRSDLTFTLVVDDFAVKYTDDRDVHRLLQTLRDTGYRLSKDWSGSRYVGLNLDWDYNNRTVDLSMPGYIERALTRFQHPTPTAPEDSPHPWQQPTYGAKTQYAEAPDNTPYLDAKNINLLQQILGVLLYYARAIDCTMLPALGSIAACQAQPTMKTMETLTQLLNYCASHPSGVVRYRASDMVLWIDSDASYLSVSEARSRAAGYYFLSSDPTKLPDPTSPPINGAITVYCQIMKHVVSSAAEAELGALFLNAQNACPLRVALEEMGHPQPATPIQTDNSTAAGIVNDKVKQKRSKAMDMRFYWIRDRVCQGQFHVYWKAGAGNKADYFTKHHATSHHRTMRPMYLQDNSSTSYYEAISPHQDVALSVPDSAIRGEGVLILPVATATPISDAPKAIPDILESRTSRPSLPSQSGDIMLINS
ncbi:hypothetical protein FisN_13Lu334 [Fistulifera solaris]|uniref:Reverse transcriptase Ty1/copia-type domain-containing protein n=1 Tax=Fistulifera solaris TaxID=1519565 RepID=A0A1Z5KM56_FISSO|nr:hypothetical protein FisN_13Lu334 [Fistulifera solaris]|eukprot:GAX27152.1 hypothetical protein FisN_13Lu334 [Fistulifera solaris]